MGEAGPSVIIGILSDTLPSAATPTIREMAATCRAVRRAPDPSYPRATESVVGNLLMDSGGHH